MVNSVLSSLASEPVASHGSKLARAVVQDEQRLPHRLMRAVHPADAGAVGHPVEVLRIADRAVEIEDHGVFARHVLRRGRPSAPASPPHVARSTCFVRVMIE
jgi:hypothetical protein